MNNKNTIKKKKVIRERIFPRLWDPTYLLTNSNIKLFRWLINCCLSNRVELKVLDLGCGYKPFKIFFPDAKEYIGIDFSYENGEPDILLDLNKDILPFSDDYFDLIIISETLEHLYDPKKVLSEAARVLKSGGFIYISTPFVFPQHGTPYDYYRYTEFFYKVSLEEYGLKIVKLQKATTFFGTLIFNFNLLMNLIGENLKIQFLTKPLIIVNNLTGICLDKIIDECFKIFYPKKREKLYYFPAGISLIAQKF